MGQEIRILVINPNTEQKMTDQIEKQIREKLPSDIRLTVRTNVAGPVSIEGHTDEIISSYYILEMLSDFKETYDGYLIACFSNHPSIAMLREITGKPVVGIAEGACHLASLLGHQFAVVTTSPKWVPMLTEAVDQFGLADKCRGIFTSGLSVENLHNLSAEKVEKEIIEAARRALDAGAEVLCLGCAGMSGIREKLENKLSVPVIDSCEAGFWELYALCKMSLSTSRYCMYAENLKRKTWNLDDKLKKFYE